MSSPSYTVKPRGWGCCTLFLFWSYVSYSFDVQLQLVCDHLHIENQPKHLGSRSTGSSLASERAAAHGPISPLARALPAEYTLRNPCASQTSVFLVLAHFQKQARCRGDKSSTLLNQQSAIRGLANEAKVCTAPPARNTTPPSLKPNTSRCHV